MPGHSPILRLIFFLVITSTLGRAQTTQSRSAPYDRSWSVDGSAVHALAQTTDGYLWVGTEDGLYRFDGYSFHKVQPDSSMSPLKRVLSLAAAEDGALWIRSEGVRLLRLKQDVFSEPVGDDEESVKLDALGTGGKGVIAATHRASAAAIRPDGTMVPLTNHLHLLVLNLAQDEKGTIWLGTRDAGVLQIAPRQKLQPLPGETPRKINCLLPDRRGTLWFGTDHGLYRFRNSKTERVSLPKRLADDTVISLMEDSLHRIWVGTVDGLFRIDPDDNDRVETVASVSPEVSVQALFEDREGNVWVAQGSSLLRLRESSASHFNPCGRQDLEDYGAFRVDPSGIWFAPRSGGLIRIRSGTCQQIAVPSKEDVFYTIQSDHRMTSIAGRSGFAWSRKDEGEFRSNDALHSADAFPIFSQQRAIDGTLWFGTLGSGAVRWNGRTAASIDDRSGLQSNTVYAIEESSDHSIWLGGPGGISIWRDGNLKALDLPGQPSSPIVLSLRSTRSGVMWIGTSQGLSFCRQGSFHTVPVTISQRGTSVYGIAEDEGGRLWLSTSDAILSLPENSAINGTLTSSQVTRVFEEAGHDSSEGIQREDAVQNGPNGEIWMIRSHGLVKIRSRLFARISQAARPQIEAAEIDGVSAPLAPPLRVIAGARRLSIDIAGLLLSSPESVMLRYRLVNFDTGWSQPTMLRQASYTNLSPGQYQFQLQASDNQDEWSRPAELDIVILPHFWQTDWFRMTAILLLMLIIALSVRLRTRYVVRQTALRIQERVDERTRIARDLHDTFFQGLQGLMLRFRTVTSQMQSGTTKELLQETLAQSVSVMEEGRDLLATLRMPEESRVQDVSGDLSRLTNQLRGKDGPQILLDVRTPPRLIREAVWRETLLICREAISNAIRHAASTTINVHFKANGDGIELTVEDNGIGLPMEALAGNRPPGRWGVLGMRERAGSIGGRFLLEARRPSGTAVRLSVPARAAYSLRLPRMLSWIFGEH